MGCDIHSRAEIRLNGEWQMLGEIFPNTHSIRWLIPTEEILEELNDGELMDIIDHFIKRRVDEGAQNNRLAIAPWTRLEWKILEYARFSDKQLNWARNGGRDQINRDEDGKFDPDGWTRFRRETQRRGGEDAQLTDAERETLKRAIIDFRYYESVEKFVEDGFRAEDFDTSHDNRLTITESRTSEDDIEWFQKDPLGSRNYSLFAVLADVRNYDGGVSPISQPKGIPEDISAEGALYMNSYGVDGHSHTWITFREFLDYDFEDDITYTGIISEAQYIAMKQRGWPEDQYVGPSSWCGALGTGESGRFMTAVFSPEGYEKWCRVGKPHVVVPSQMADGPQLTEDSFDDTDEYSEPICVDLWRDVYQWSDEQIEQAEKSDMSESRYIYNYMKPNIHASWKERRKNVMGEEFKNMMRIFQELVDDYYITEDDIRLIAFFDN